MIIVAIMTCSNNISSTQQEKAKQLKDELIERAETAEFQIATLSQEYRKIFQEKDVSC